MFGKFPRLTICLVVSLALMTQAYLFRQSYSLIAVSLYKMHLTSPGGWCDCWVNRVAADNRCKQIAFALSAYNDGLDWIN